MNALNQQILDSLDEINAKLDRLLARLEPVQQPPPCRCLADAILKATAEFFQISATALCGHARPAHIAKARFFFYGALHEFAGLSPTSIGMLCGGRTHKAVTCGLARLKDRRESWPDWKSDWQRYVNALDNLLSKA